MRKYGLVGYPLSHSFSKRFFTELFSKNAIEAEYLNFEIPDLTALPSVIREHPELVGFNVTIPHKGAVIPYLDHCDEKAAAIQAVNTVKISRTDGKIELTGYNTDLIGFRDSLLPLLKPHHKKALVLGTGGASKAVIAVLKELSIQTQLVSREENSGTTISYAQLNSDIMEEYTIIVNTTPLGTYPKIDGFPEIPYNYLTNKHLLFDLVYNPAVTQFLQKGAEKGATIKNGLEMLELQAMAAWKIWEM
ncbi:MAG TPA: shikimate dehydrogenase [Prolixibacteraceae bacterium]|nr:shikimate dehydrogenase [Prolixibacteraceae bacterium]